MAVLRRSSSPSGPTARWRFRPSPRTELRRDEPGAFRARLETALRVGHGLGVEFGVIVEASAEPTVLLAANGAMSCRWISRVLFPAYGRHQWEPDGDGTRPAISVGLYGHRLRSWPAMLAASPDSSPMLDAWVATFANLPRGVVLEVRLRTSPVVPRRWWEDSAPRATHLLTSASPSARPTMRRDLSSDLGRSEPERPVFWRVTLRLGMRRDILASGKETLGPEVATAIEQASRTAEGNGLTFRRRLRLGSEKEPEVAAAMQEIPLFLPSPECPAYGDRWIERRNASLLPLGRSASGMVVGTTIEPDQGRHVAVLGETGMGKSSLLVALARRAVKASGVVLFDPIGDTASAFDRELGGRDRERSIRIAPRTSALAVNALEGIVDGGPRDRVRSERRLNDLVHSLRRVRSGRYTDSSFWGPRLEEMLTRAVRAAAALPAGTLVDAHTLLATGARLHRGVPSDATGPIRELSERIRERPEDAEGARRLLYEIVRSPVLNGMLCSTAPDLVAAQLVEPGRIVILSGDAPHVGESVARYLLSVYLALVWSEVLSRPHPSKVFVILDEAQWFSHESLAEMLRLGRRANLHVILATQSVASLPETVAEAVWTNVSDFVAFRGSPEEAREFAHAARGLSTDSLLSLPRGHAAVLLGKGNTIRWLRTMRLPARVTRDPTGPLGPEASPPPVFTAGGTSEPNGAPRELARDVLGIETPPARGFTPSEVLEVLRRRAESLLPGSRLRVSLEELRRSVDPRGNAVRVAGSALGRAGAIVSVERSDEGTVWCIAPDRIPGPESLGTAENRRVDADEAQPS